MGKTLSRGWIVWIYACLFVNISVGYAQLSAVGPQLGIEVSLQGRYDHEFGTFHSNLMYARVASAQQIDPGSKGIGLVRTVFLAAGARTENFDTYDFRWRAGLITMDFVRTPLSMGLTLVDYNKIDLLELDVRWINLRLGPSLYIGSNTTYFTLKAVGTGGVTTMKIGTFAYTGLEAASELNSRKRNYEIGYLGEAKILINDRVYLAGEFQYRHLLGGLRPKRYTATGRLGVRVSDVIHLEGFYSLEEMRLARTSLDRQLISGRLALIF